MIPLFRVSRSLSDAKSKIIFEICHIYGNLKGRYYRAWLFMPFKLKVLAWPCLINTGTSMMDQKNCFILGTRQPSRFQLTGGITICH